MAVALALPFAYAMNPVIAIAFLVSVYCASITGGGIHGNSVPYTRNTVQCTDHI